MSKLQVVELFAGLGAPRKALNNLNIDHEVVGFSMSGYKCGRIW